MAWRNIAIDLILSFYRIACIAARETTNAGRFHFCKGKRRIIFNRNEKATCKVGILFPFIVNTTPFSHWQDPMDPLNT